MKTEKVLKAQTKNPVLVVKTHTSIQKLRLGRKMRQ